jgi:hypothetical protein
MKVGMGCGANCIPQFIEILSFVKDGEMEKHAGIPGLGLARNQYQTGIQEYLISARLLV